MYLHRVDPSCAFWQEEHHSWEHCPGRRDLTSVEFVTRERRNHSTFSGMDVGASLQQIHSTVQLTVPCCSFSSPSLSSSALLEVPPWLPLSEPALRCLGSEQSPKSTRRISAEAQNTNAGRQRGTRFPGSVWVAPGSSAPSPPGAKPSPGFAAHATARALVRHLLYGHPPPVLDAGCSAPSGFG